MLANHFKHLSADPHFSGLTPDQYHVLRRTDGGFNQIVFMVAITPPTT